jgi:sodium-independent sulfate anion transporter 11
MKIVEEIKHDFKTDVNWNRAARLGVQGAKALPSASAKYLLGLVPIVSWLPRYDPRWLLNDLIAGLTLGLMLIPQGLSYAKLAGIPVQYGLMSSWLPARYETSREGHTLSSHTNTIRLASMRSWEQARAGNPHLPFKGTGANLLTFHVDLSTGPTSLIGLLTSEIVEDLQDEYSPSAIASAVALMMGVYGMAIGKGIGTSS